MPYTAVSQCVDDLKLLYAADELDIRRKDGETVTSVLRSRIQKEFKAGSRRFYKQLAQCRYTYFDLQLIALHDLVGKRGDFEDFLVKLRHTSDKAGKIRSIIKSQAFRSGRLEWLNAFLPGQLTCRGELVAFIKASGHIARPTLFTICSVVAKRQWKTWLNEAVMKKEIWNVGAWR